MERIDRNDSRAGRPERKADTPFLPDFANTPAERARAWPDPRTERRRAGDDAGLSPEVIRRWLACLAVALLGLGLFAQPGAAMEPAAAGAVGPQS
jgi:hypothetical protein